MQCLLSGCNYSSWVTWLGLLCRVPREQVHQQFSLSTPGGVSPAPGALSMLVFSPSEPFKPFGQSESWMLTKVASKNQQRLIHGRIQPYHSVQTCRENFCSTSFIRSCIKIYEDQSIMQGIKCAETCSILQHCRGLQSDMLRVLLVKLGGVWTRRKPASSRPRIRTKRYNAQSSFWGSTGS